MSIQQQDLFAVLHRFGQSAGYRPKHGQRRDIVGVADRRTDYREAGGQMQYVRVLRLTVLKDATNETYGGIEFPDVGDMVTLDSVDYAFTGAAFNENSYGWELEFQSTTIKRFGSNAGPQ